MPSHNPPSPPSQHYSNIQDIHPVERKACKRQTGWGNTNIEGTDGSWLLVHETRAVTLGSQHSHSSGVKPAVNQQSSFISAYRIHADPRYVTPQGFSRYTASTKTKIQIHIFWQDKLCFTLLTLSYEGKLWRTVIKQDLSWNLSRATDLNNTEYIQCISAKPHAQDEKKNKTSKILLPCQTLY